MKVIDFTIDRENKTIHVKKDFDAPLEKVWQAWTQGELLDQWWAPEPWKARTKHLDFSNGGYWLYYMMGPNGEKQWSRADYKNINPRKSFSILCAFCNEDGITDTNMPQSEWKHDFTDNDQSTVVEISIKYGSVEDLEKEIEMGFKDGFTVGLENLDKLLASQK